MGDPWMWAAAGSAALAVGLWLPGPSRLRRLSPDDGRVLPVDAAAWLGARSGSTITVSQRLLAAGAAGIGSGALLFSWLSWTALGVGVLVGAVAGIAVGWLEPSSVRRRRWSYIVQTPQVLDLLAAGLVSGRPLRRATSSVVIACPGPVAEDLGRVLHLIDLGMSEVDAWRTMARHPHLGAVAVDLSRSADSGTQLVATLTSHATDARAARRSALEVAARKVGVRSVLPLMTCFIPAFLLLGVVPTTVSALARVFSGP